MNSHLKRACLLLLASFALTLADQLSPPQLSPNLNNEIDDKMPEKPEPRQIGQIGQMGVGVPYGWLQPAQAQSAPAPASSSWAVSAPSWFTSSGQSLLSMLRPNVVGGRRSSLTSRLRNLMNALFYSGSFLRRETTSPYLTSGSSYSYAFRPPPFGFGSSFPTTGLSSALGNQNLYGSASSYRPVVLPNYPSAPADAWSNYKQYASAANSQPSFSASSMPASWSSGTGSGSSGSSSSAIWPQSGSSSGSGSSGSQYPGLSSGSSYPSYSSGSGSSNGGYQAAASNVYPSSSYQRSSVNTYSKPQTSANTSVSSSVSSSSSSSSSSTNPKPSGYQSK